MLQADRNVSSFLINSFYILFFEETEIRPEMFLPGTFKMILSQCKNPHELNRHSKF